MKSKSWTAFSYSKEPNVAALLEQSKSRGGLSGFVHDDGLTRRPKFPRLVKTGGTGSQGIYFVR